MQLRILGTTYKPSPPGLVLLGIGLEIFWGVERLIMHSCHPQTALSALSPFVLDLAAYPAASQAVQKRLRPST